MHIFMYTSNYYNYTGLNVCMHQSDVTSVRSNTVLTGKYSLYMYVDALLV